MYARQKRGFGSPVGVAAVLLAGACWSIVVACSSDDAARAGFVSTDASDATTTTEPSLDGTFAPDDAGNACQPVMPVRPLTAAAPKPFAPGSCTTAQIDGYLKECLSSDGNACKTYKDANAACAACVEFTSADASWGPIVFYENRQYYDYNYGGCIANVTGDLTDSGCGAAETRYLECRHTACVECLPSGLPRDYAPFYACENALATDKLCANELKDVSASCAAYFATKPTDACQGAGIPAEQYLKQLITAWCGGTASDAGDAGDGGDGG